MNRFWVRLSGAFVGVSLLTAIFIFSLYFVLSWALVQPTDNPQEYRRKYEDVTAPYVESLIVAGKSDAEIVALLDNGGQLQRLLRDKRSDGFAQGVDIEDRSFGRIAADYISELINLDSILTIVIGSLFGIIASILFSRQLVRPLAKLTQASYALGDSDLSQRVMVQGSDEINELAATFNKMAAQLKQNETVRQNMLADISHELRTPLAGLEGSLRATLDGVFELDKERIAHLYQQTRHLSRLVDDLHLLARADAKRLSLDKTPVDFAQLLAQMAEIFGVLAHESGVTLETELELLRPISADEGRIRQIVSNLLNNALRHTPSGGSITLALRHTGDSAEIVVEDTGEGISAEHLPHLFDRFYRADKSRSRETGGTGLGLAITKALVVSHGGDISAESNSKNGGTVFRVNLPLQG
ncbi:MAG: ATP-binding protein [Chloroflexales bacterium]|nr:ATP-binding protein [Chloroflexales bacterium]